MLQAGLVVWAAGSSFTPAQLAQRQAHQRPSGSSTPASLSEPGQSSPQLGARTWSAMMLGSTQSSGPGSEVSYQPAGGSAVLAALGSAVRRLQQQGGVSHVVLNQAC